MVSVISKYNFFLFPFFQPQFQRPIAEICLLRNITIQRLIRSVSAVFELFVLFFFSFHFNISSMPKNSLRGFSYSLTIGNALRVLSLHGNALILLCTKFVITFIFSVAGNVVY